MLAAPVALVSANVVLAPPEREAVTEYPPATVPAMAVICARPVAAVVAVVAPRTAVAPLPGAAKVTAAPETTFPNESVTATISGAPNAALTAADWPLPLTTAIRLAGPFTLVSEKTAGVPTVAVDALIVYL